MNRSQRRSSKGFSTVNGTDTGYEAKNPASYMMMKMMMMMMMLMMMMMMTTTTMTTTMTTMCTY